MFIFLKGNGWEHESFLATRIERQKRRESRAALTLGALGGPPSRADWPPGVNYCSLDLVAKVLRDGISAVRGPIWAVGRKGVLQVRASYSQRELRGKGIPKRGQLPLIFQTQRFF